MEGLEQLKTSNKYICKKSKDKVLYSSRIMITTCHFGVQYSGEPEVKSYESP